MCVACLEEILNVIFECRYEEKKKRRQKTIIVDLVITLITPMRKIEQIFY